MNQRGHDTPEIYAVHTIAGVWGGREYHKLFEMLSKPIKTNKYLHFPGYTTDQGTTLGRVTNGLIIVHFVLFLVAKATLEIAGLDHWYSLSLAWWAWWWEWRWSERSRWSDSQGMPSRTQCLQAATLSLTPLHTTNHHINFLSNILYVLWESVEADLDDDDSGEGWRATRSRRRRGGAGGRAAEVWRGQLGVTRDRAVREHQPAAQRS